MKNIRKSPPFINSLFFMMLVLLITSCGTSSEPQQETLEASNEQPADRVSFTSEQLEVAGIVLGKAEMRPVSGAIYANGMLDIPPQSLASVSVPIAGYVKSTELLEGSKVNKGQVIATLDGPEYIQLQQDYLDTKSNADYLQLEYERQQELARENVNAAKILQKAESDYKRARAKLRSIGEKLKMLDINPVTLNDGNLSNTIRLRSPISGYVTEVNVSIGKNVSPSDVLFEIVDTEHLHAEITVYEKDISNIEEGQRILFTLVNEAKEREAEVYLIGREISDDRTVRIHGHLKEKNPKLLPGMYLKAKIYVDDREALTLPEAAVIDFEGQSYTFVVSGENNENGNTSFQMVPIEQGISTDGFTEITLSEGRNIQNEAFVLEGAYDLLSKMQNSDE